MGLEVVEVVTQKDQIPALEFPAGTLVKKEDISPELAEKVKQALAMARRLVGEPEVVAADPDYSAVNSKMIYIPEAKAHIRHIMAGGGKSIKDGAALYNGTEIVTPDFSIMTTNITDAEQVREYGEATIVARGGSKMVETMRLSDVNSFADKFINQKEAQIDNFSSNLNKVLQSLQRVSTPGASSS